MAKEIINSTITGYNSSMTVSPVNNKHAGKWPTSLQNYGRKFRFSVAICNDEITGCVWLPVGNFSLIIIPDQHAKIF